MERFKESDRENFKSEKPGSVEMNKPSEEEKLTKWDEFFKPYKRKLISIDEYNELMKKNKNYLQDTLKIFLFVGILFLIVVGGVFVYRTYYPEDFTSVISNVCGNVTLNCPECPSMADNNCNLNVNLTCPEIPEKFTIDINAINLSVS